MVILVGIVTLTKNTKLYVCVGGQGSSVTGGYNGGGYGNFKDKTNYRAGGGGGATHIGLKNDILKNYKSDYASNLFIVAGGGGGGGHNCNGANGYVPYGGTGGGLVGGSGGRGYSGNRTYYAGEGNGGTQIAGGVTTSSNPWYPDKDGRRYGENGDFGQGGNAGNYAVATNCTCGDRWWWRWRIMAEALLEIEKIILAIVKEQAVAVVHLLQIAPLLILVQRLFSKGVIQETERQLLH